MVSKDSLLNAIYLFGGFQVVLCGLVVWIGQLLRDRANAELMKRLESMKSALQQSRDRANAELMERLESVKNALQQSATMHKSRFDREFEVYSRLWPKVRRLRDANEALFQDLGRPKPVSRDKLVAYREAVKALRDTVEDDRPFFSTEIATDLFALLKEAETEARRYARVLREKPEGPKTLELISPYPLWAIIAIREACERTVDQIRGVITGNPEPSTKKAIKPAKYFSGPLRAEPGPTILKSSTGEAVELRDDGLEPTGHKYVPDPRDEGREMTPFC